jgi:ATP-dependent DNA ligase
MSAVVSHVTSGRFRHGRRFIRFRPDKAPVQCRMDQIIAQVNAMKRHFARLAAAG